MGTASSAKTLHWYHPELDILRFSSFAAIFLFHATGGDFKSVYGPLAYSIDLFFALSSYLITEILLREQRTYGSFNLRAFYIRRILRIWPLYFVFLGLTFLFAQRLLGTEDFPLSAKVMFLLFVGNWQFLLGRHIGTISSLLWSVCMEEQFYLSWPLLLRRWSSRMPWIGAGLLLFATAYRFSLYLHGPVARPIDTYWKGTFSHMDPIVVGSLAAFALNGQVPRLTRMQRLLVGAAGIGGMLVAGWVGAPYGGRALFSYPLGSFSAAAILLAVLHPMRPERPGRLQALLIHLGRISYGLYVFHGASLVYARKFAIPGHATLTIYVQIVGAFLLTLTLAECSYRVLELPFLRLKDRFSAVKSAPVSPELPTEGALQASV